MKFKKDIQAAFYKAHVISSTEFENMLLGFVRPAVLLITFGGFVSAHRMKVE